MRLVTRALLFATRAHGINNQRRKYNNEPYICHPIRVAESLFQFNDDHLVCAAYCHDVLEDTPVTEEMMRDELGNDVTNLVLEVTNVSKKTDGNRKVRKAIDLEHLKKASERAKLLKLSDVYDNMSDTENMKKDYLEMYLNEKWDVVGELFPTSREPLRVKFWYRTNDQIYDLAYKNNILPLGEYHYV